MPPRNEVPCCQQPERGGRDTAKEASCDIRNRQPWMPVCEKVVGGSRQRGEGGERAEKAGTKCRPNVTRLREHLHHQDEQHRQSERSEDVDREDVPRESVDAWRPRTADPVASQPTKDAADEDGDENPWGEARRPRCLGSKRWWLDRIGNVRVNGQAMQVIVALRAGDAVTSPRGSQEPSAGRRFD
jgi:hypothetical protein